MENKSMYLEIINACSRKLLFKINCEQLVQFNRTRLPKFPVSSKSEKKILIQSGYRKGATRVIVMFSTVAHGNKNKINKQRKDKQ